MIIESVDGNYYQDPEFIRNEWVAKWEDELWIFYWVGKRAVKATKFGFKGPVQNWHPQQQVFADGSLKPCQVASIALKQPIPAPDRWAVKYADFLPKSEELLCWSYPFTWVEVDRFIKGEHVPDLEAFLGKDARRKISRQTGIPLKEWSSFAIGDIIKLKRRDPYFYVPGLP